MHREDPQNRLANQPERSASPTKKVTVKGRKDSSLELWLGTEYVTTMEGCRSQAVRETIYGAPKIAQRVTDLKRIPAGTDDFSVDFYLDLYAPGDCGWRPLAIVYGIFDPKMTAGPLAINSVVKVMDGGPSETKLTQRCEVIPTSDTKSGVRLRCLWVGGFTPERYSISLEGGIVELSYTK